MPDRELKWRIHTSVPTSDDVRRVGVPTADAGRIYSAACRHGTATDNDFFQVNPSFLNEYSDISDDELQSEHNCTQ